MILLAIDLEWSAEVRESRLTPIEIKEITGKVTQLQLLREMLLIFLMVKKLEVSAYLSLYAPPNSGRAKNLSSCTTVSLN